MNNPGKLYLFPVPLDGQTPVGDVLPTYNVDLLRGIKHFIVENLRSARRFLKAVDPAIDISGLCMVELSEHTPPGEVPAMLTPLEQGHDMGLLSEAGCPAVADPGADAVTAAQQRGFEVVPLVGPSSILMSLMASGLNGQAFAFQGYLPNDAKQRENTLRQMVKAVRSPQRQTQIFIETPYRNDRLLAELANSLPDDILLTVACDITGPRQTIITRPAPWWRTPPQSYQKLPTIFLIGRSNF